MSKQKQIAQIFGKSQSWVSRKQGQSGDPMPRDREGAIAWGRRNGLLPASEDLDLIPLQTPAMGLSPMSAADLALKQRREEALRLDLKIKNGQLLDLAEVERRELVQIANFKRAVIDFPKRVQIVLERHVSDSQKIWRICQDLERIPAELLNNADPYELFKTRTIEEVRAILCQQVEEIIKAALE